MVLGQSSSAEGVEKWSLFGDYRVRYEYTDSYADFPERHREVLRFRAGVELAVNDWLKVGARVVTGSLSDPRTADVTVSDFVDDLEIGLDRAYVMVSHDESYVVAGKFVNPFMRTELAWDNDVNPSGIAGVYDVGRIGGINPRLAGIFMVVDEQAAGEDSYMWGGQAQAVSDPSPTVHLGLGVAYWDYTIGSLSHAAPGNIRGNYLTADGTQYQSDFDLVDVALTVEYGGLGERCPARLEVEYVENQGAAVAEDEGFWAAVTVGDSWVENQLSFHYDYARCETDAVLGTFSHDNLPLATNYENHTLKVGYGVLRDTQLSLTLYVFQTLERGTALPALVVDDLTPRVRLDLMMRF